MFINKKMFCLDLNQRIEAMKSTRHRSIKPTAAAIALILVPGHALLAQQDTLEGDTFSSGQDEVIIHPVDHASLLLQWQDQTLYVDPVGGSAQYEGLPEADLVLITHGHGDHYDLDTLQSLVSDQTQLVLTEEVSGMTQGAFDEQAEILNNGETTEFGEISVAAIPAYNTTEERLQYHPEGVGNGYVLGLGDLRVYIAGDTEDIEEMRALTDIDVAFIPMNLPYTMTVEQAADAVNAFAPSVVYPYHYRGSDVEAFRDMVDEKIDVRIGNWYEEGN